MRVFASKRYINLVWDWNGSNNKVRDTCKNKQDDDDDDDGDDDEIRIYTKY